MKKSYLVLLLLCLSPAFIWALAKKTGDESPEVLEAATGGSSQTEDSSRRYDAFPAPNLADSKQRISTGSGDAAELEDTSKHESWELHRTIHQTPARVYRQYIEAAEDGDPTSQFLVAKSLETCDYPRPSKQQLEAMERDQNVKQSTRDLVYDRIARCEELYKMMPDTVTREAHQSWRKTAAANGSHIAMLEIETQSHAASVDWERIVELIPRAFEEAGHDSYLRRKVIFSLNSYINTMGEWRNDDRLAWGYLVCRYTPDCPESAYFNEAFDNSYRDHEVQSFIDRAMEIDKAIDDSDWDTVDLRYQ